MSYERNKPYPEAVATERGWVDHITGELLVSIRGLATKMAQFQNSSAEPVTVEVEVPAPVAKIEIPVEVVADVVEPVIETQGEITEEAIEKAQEEIEQAVEQADEAVQAAVAPEPKKRGRKPKAQ